MISKLQWDEILSFYDISLLSICIFLYPFFSLSLRFIRADNWQFISYGYDFNHHNQSIFGEWFFEIHIKYI